MATNPLWLAAAFVLFVAYSWIWRYRPYPGIPVVRASRRGIWDFFIPAKFHWMTRAEEMVAAGVGHGGPFQVRAASGWKVILPNRFVEEIKSNPNFDFNETMRVEFPVHLPGWEGMREGLRGDGLFTDLVRVKLTQSLNHIAEDMVDESDYALRLWLSDNTDAWETHELFPIAFDVIARITSRVFAGKDLSRNEAYLRIAKENTAMSFVAGYQMLQFPRFLWPLLNYILPGARVVRKQYRDATALLQPYIEATKARYAQNEAEKGPKTANALGWMIEIQKGRPLELKNFVGEQLSLSMASIENTSKLLACCLLECTRNPVAVQEVRAEMVAVLQQDGWSKTSLQKMKLLDSFLREVQRIHNFLAIMHRYVQKRTVLSDGTVLPAGSMFLVLDSGTRDPNIYPEPDKFIANRHLQMRDAPGAGNRHHLVSTSADNLGFGLGQHECPGRFFVAHEIKTLMIMMLLRYDWRSEPGYVTPGLQLFEHNRVFPRDMKIQARRRREEVDLLDRKYS